MSADSQFPLFLIPLLPFLGAAVNLIFGRRLSRETVHLVACGSVGASAVVGLHAIFFKLFPLWRAWHEAGGAAPRPAIRDHVYTWIASGDLSIDMSFLLDPLSAVMVFTITVIGLLIHIYSTGYMSHDPRYAAYFGYLNLFTGSMLVLVLGDSLPVMFIGWEGVGLCSFLLIGFWFDKDKNANAGRKAFIVNRIGDFAFLLGIFLLYTATKKVDFAGLEASLPRLRAPLAGPTGLPLAFFAGLLLFIGATGKSAQIPLYVWLPDAMAGPTPVSALIHAATMVTAGVYMIARLSFLYLASPEVMMIVTGVGAATAIFAALIGFAQTDIKKVLAYSTVSQLGFMFVAVGTGSFVAGVFHLFTHAWFKAGLFLGAGSVMHAMGDRTEIMEMGGLRKKIRWTHLTFVIYCLAIAGFPLTSGFFSKDEVLLGAFTANLAGWPDWYGKLIWGVLTVTALGTAFYMWRLYFLVFWGRSRADEETQAHIHESPPVMTVPLLILAFGALVLGFIGMPHIGGLHNYLAEWLAPSLAAGPQHHVATATALGLMGVATLAGLLGIGIAYFFYKDGPEGRIRDVVAALAPLRKVVANKFYVDEIYDAIIVRPFRWIAHATFNVVDRFVIDLVFVNGSAFVVDVSGRVARWWQSGDVQRYLTAMLVGAAAIFWLVTRAPTTEFEAKPSPSGTYAWTFTAAGAADPREVTWDLDGDGTIDFTGSGFTHTFPGPGRYRVSMNIKDPKTGTTRTSAQTVVVEPSRGGARGGVR